MHRNQGRFPKFARSLANTIGTYKLLTKGGCIPVLLDGNVVKSISDVSSEMIKHKRNLLFRNYRHDRATSSLNHISYEGWLTVYNDTMNEATHVNCKDLAVERYRIVLEELKQSFPDYFHKTV